MILCNLTYILTLYNLISFWLQYKLSFTKLDFSLAHMYILNNKLTADSKNESFSSHQNKKMYWRLKYKTEHFEFEYAFKEICICNMILLQHSFRLPSMFPFQQRRKIPNKTGNMGILWTVFQKFGIVNCIISGFV